MKKGQPINKKTSLLAKIGIIVLVLIMVASYIVQLVYGL